MLGDLLKRGEVSRVALCAAGKNVEVILGGGRQFGSISLFHAAWNKGR